MREKFPIDFSEGFLVNYSIGAFLQEKWICLYHFSLMIQSVVLPFEIREKCINFTQRRTSVVSAQQQRSEHTLGKTQKHFGAKI